MSLENIPAEFVPLSVNYRRDRAIRRVGLEGEVLFLRSLAFARGNSTEGIIEDFDLDELGQGMADPYAAAEKLVAARLWIANGEGWMIRSWEKWNPPTSPDRGGYGNHVRWHVKKDLVSPDCRFCTSENIPLDRTSIVRGSGDDRTSIVRGSGESQSREEKSRREKNTTHADADADADADVRADADVDQFSLVEPPIDAKPLVKPTRYPDDFEQWWKHYPKKTSKGAAGKAWKKAKAKASLETLIAAADAYAQCEPVSRGYVKDGATWLNAECWLDDLTPATPKRTTSPEEDWS